MTSSSNRGNNTNIPTGRRGGPRRRRNVQPLPQRPATPIMQWVPQYANMELQRYIQRLVWDAVDERNAMVSVAQIQSMLVGVSQQVNQQSRDLRQYGEALNQKEERDQQLRTDIQEMKRRMDLLETSVRSIENMLFLGEEGKTPSGGDGGGPVDDGESMNSPNEERNS